MKIITYSSEYKDKLLKISLEWLNRYDLLEDVDIEMVSNPERMIDGGGQVFLAQKEDGEIVGMVMVEDQGEACEILKLAVKESARGMGAGQMLMETALQFIRSKGKKKAVLCTSQKLAAARHIYEKLGFQYIEYEKNHFDLSDTSMELVL